MLHADSPYTHGPTSSVRTGSGPPLAAPAAEGLLLGDFMGVPSRAGPAAQCASERDCCWLQLLGARAANRCKLPALPAGRNTNTFLYCFLRCTQDTPQADAERPSTHVQRSCAACCCVLCVRPVDGHR